jgi:hypothetical protein
MVGIAALDILPPEKEIVETIAYGVGLVVPLLVPSG